ncbi:MAG: type III pantothenate kinase [Proteobacteria bacterium]|nr:type III pantothenate kinase [Pseudomonadota bacterium]MBI3498904.1 type III pantothenate kinase [Pseudomonadota bacterium]
MLLAINANNTNCKFAIFDGETMLGPWRSATDPRRTADEYGVWLIQLLNIAGIERGQVRDTIIASVVPDGLYELKTFCRRYFDSEPLVIGEAAVNLGVRATIERPEEAGADRLVNAAEAHRHYGGPAIVVDFGTATTFDVIDGEGNYAGGVIAPGPNLSVDALYRAAAKLPHIALKRPASVIGRATVPAMQSGVFWGYVGLVEGIVARIKAEFGRPMKVITTGGLAPLFADAIPAIEHLDPDLTLRGLLHIHRLNRSS